MLAYLFWHWPSPDVDAGEYEQLQRDFQAALGAAGPPLFRESVVFRVHGSAPWLGSAPAYADWYLVESSAGLDELNSAAVSGACKEPHDRAARAAAAGAGSLLGLRNELGGARSPDLAGARTVTWLTKPKGMPYDDFYAAVAAIPSASSSRPSLWRRQMVLGPTPEFGLLSAEGLQQHIPQTFQPLRLDLTPVWSGR